MYKSQPLYNSYITNITFLLINTVKYESGMD